MGALFPVLNSPFRKDVTQEGEREIEPQPNSILHSNVDSEFGWVSIQFQNHQKSTISLITEASVFCLSLVAPSGQRLNVKLLDICHIKESLNVPGSFETARNKITSTWQNGSRWGGRGSCQCCNIEKSLIQCFTVNPPLPLSLSVRLCLTLSAWLHFTQMHIQLPLSFGRSLSFWLILPWIILWKWQDCFRLWSGSFFVLIVFIPWFSSLHPTYIKPFFCTNAEWGGFWVDLGLKVSSIHRANTSGSVFPSRFIESCLESA